MEPSFRKINYMMNASRPNPLKNTVTMRLILLIQGLIFLMLSSCEDAYNKYDDEVTIPDFNFPQTVVFEPMLSAYGIYDGAPVDLIPSSDYHLLELSSTLFTDYAHKPRLLHVPHGSMINHDVTQHEVILRYASHECTLSENPAA